MRIILDVHQLVAQWVVERGEPSPRAKPQGWELEGGNWREWFSAGAGKGVGTSPPPQERVDKWGSLIMEPRSVSELIFLYFDRKEISLDAEL